MQSVKNLPWRGDRLFFYLFLALLLAILYGPILLKWYDGWLNKNISIEHEYFSHGIIGLPYAAYVVWENRSSWRALPDRFHPLGVFLLGLGSCCYLAGSSEVVYLSLPLVLAGICLWLKGMPGFKLYWFPLLLVFLATPNPIPYLLTPHTLGLQKFIADAVGLILNQVGVPVKIEGIYLLINNRPVEIAPHCAGLKMLFTGLYVGLILLHWTKNLGNRRLVLLVLSGSVAINFVANIIRNGLLTWYYGNGQKQAFASLHGGFAGDLYSAVMLVAIFGLLKVLHCQTKACIAKPEPALPNQSLHCQTRVRERGVSLSISRLVLLFLLALLAATSAVPGYLQGNWQWSDLPRVRNIYYLKKVRQLGLPLPGWQIGKRRLVQIDEHFWNVQILEKEGQTPVTIYLMPQQYYRMQPQVEWNDIEWVERWKTDSLQSLTFSLPGKVGAQVRANFFRAWREQTYAVVQWYAWAQGGSPDPAHWFWADQQAQLGRQRASWIAVCLKIPIDPFSDLNSHRPFAKSLAQKVQATLEGEVFSANRQEAPRFPEGERRHEGQGS